MGIEYGERRSTFIDYGRPSLFLDFARRKSLIDSMSETNLITFTRSSTGTYVGSDGLIKTAAADEPRFDHDPETGESLGLLIEESRTNYQDYSVDINTGRDILTGSTLTANAATALDGTTTATRITGSGVDENTRLGWNTQGTSNTQYNVFSVFVKADSGTPILGFYSNTFVAGAVVFNINLSDGSTNTINGFGDFFSKVVAYPNGWYRVTVMGGPGTGPGGSWNINLVPSLTSARGASSGSNASASYLIWGVQEELVTAPFPTSYIPTSGSTVTRQPDITKITGTNFTDFYNSDEGTIYSEFTYGIRPWHFANDDANPNQRFFGFSDPSGGIRVGRRIGGSYTYLSAPTTGSYGRGDNIKSVAAYDNTNFVVGAFGQVATSGTTNGNTGIDRLLFYQSPSNPDTNGTIKKLLYYPTRLTNTQLQALTQ